MNKILLLTATLFALVSVKAQTVAHWKFDPAHASSGTIEDGNLVLEDLSGNGNNLEFKVLINNGSYGDVVSSEDLTEEQKQHLSNAFEWREDSYGNQTGTKNLFFKEGGRKEFWDLSGYFQTAEDASINTESFTEGYTIEMLFKMPPNFKREKHRWISLINKHGSAKQLKEKYPSRNYVGGDAGSTIANLNISDLRELQWTHYSNEDLLTQENTYDNGTGWSFSLDDDDTWYHVVLINNTQETKVYINGVLDFRNVDVDTYPQDGGIAETVASNFGWDIGAKGDTFDQDNDEDGFSDYEIKKIYNGQIQEVRFTKGALPESEWLYSDMQSATYTDIGTNEDISLLTNENNYTMVFVPDTQKPIRYMPEIVDTQMQWIADNDEENNIIFTNFLGDLVDRWNQQYEWDNILNSLQSLKDGNARFMTVDGNHDGYEGAFGQQADNDQVTTYSEVFGPEYYEGEEYYFNQSPSRHAAYSIVRGGNYTYLNICVSYYLQQYLADLEWVQNVINEYHYLPVIFSTHKHLEFEEDGSGVFRSDDREYEHWSDPANGGYTLEQLYGYFRFAWQRILKGNDNVFMAMSGHHHGAGYQIADNDFGHPVFEGVYDYQSGYHGGNGWMNFLEFDEAENKINFRVFSPWVASIPDDQKTFFDVKYLTRPEEHFTYDINFSERFSFYPTVTENNINGMSVQLNYNNTQDIENTAVVIYPAGAEATPENEVARFNITDINVNEGVATFELSQVGDYYAVIRKEGLYVPISTRFDFTVDNLSTVNVKKETAANVAPSPFKDYINVKAEDNINVVKFFSANGSLVKTEKGNSAKEMKVNTENLAKGFYVVQVTTNKDVSNVKVVKE